MFAVLNVYKPLELTSHDVVARLRKIYNLKKIGHLGTLDPLAEGVLPVCLGQATRLIEYFPSDKQYIAQVTFGITTDTLDRAGSVLSQTPCPEVSPDHLAAILPQFIGTTAQQVPMHSAVHVDGKKLYKYAQQGQVVETPTKIVTIYGIECLEWSDLGEAHPTVRLRVDCASGTYIRSLARDLGEALGCGAYLSGLIRSRHGRFSTETAVPLETLQTSAHPQQFLENPVSYLDLPIILLADEAEVQRIRHGMKVPIPEQAPPMNEGQPCFLQFQDKPIAVAQAEDSQLQPVKVFIGS